MNKIDALIEIMRDARSERASTASAKRIVKAAKTLGLDDKETLVLMNWLEYCDSSGEPYGHTGIKIQRVWP